jgi:hypothetical protein
MEELKAQLRQNILTTTRKDGAGIGLTLSKIL